MNHNIHIIGSNISYTNIGNRNISINTTFEPALWCNKEWMHLLSPCNGLGELVKRILMFVPLVFASLVAYPISLFYLSSTITIDPPINIKIGSGILQEKLLDLNPDHIQEVELNAYGNLTIKKGNENSINIKADDNLIDNIETRIENNKLIIAMKSGAFQFSTSPTFVLNIPTSLNLLSVNGSGNATIDELVTDLFTCNIKGSGSVNVLKGTVDRQTIVISGSGDYIAPNLLGSVSNVTIKGSGESIIHAKNALNVSIRGSGECRYYGNPQAITEKIQGSGSLHHIDSNA